MAAVPVMTAKRDLWLTGVYFMVAYGILFLYTADSPFCSRPGDAGHAVITVRLALACTVWDFVAGLCGLEAFRVIRKKADLPAIAPLVSAVITASGLASIPLWLYRGYGRFLFENTWADVSCFFTEGYGFMFPFVVAPVLAVASFGRVVLVLVARAGDEGE
jgi:hypothetical protein